MSELKPCKCRCGDELTLRYEGAYQHPRSHATGQRDKCLMSLVIVSRHEIERWNALMSDTPDLLRGARIGLDMAAKIGEGGLDELDQDWFLPKLRSIPDSDIMKEISRE